MSNLLLVIIAFIFIFQLSTSTSDGFNDTVENSTEADQASKTLTKCCNATCFEGCDEIKCRSDTDCAGGERCCEGDCKPENELCLSKTRDKVILSIVVSVAFLILVCCLFCIHPSCPLREAMEDRGWQFEAKCCGVRCD